MKLLRFSLLPALLLLIALPSAADVRGTPTIEGPPPASIEGTISSLNTPVGSDGPIVSLLGGLVFFDATGAKVRFANGTEGTTDDLEPGQRIVAFVDPAVDPLKATAIVIMALREDVALTGKVEAVDTAARTLTVLGFTAKVTDRTVFGGPWDGVGQTGLEDVKVGDLVLVAATADGGSLVATRVMKLSPSPTPTVRLHGTVKAIGTVSWTIVLPDGAEVVLKIDAETRILGEPRVDDEVDVLARRQSDGSLLAALIMKSVPPPVATVRYQGIVKEIGPATWTIGPKAGDGPDRVFTVNEKTRIEGAPVVGDEVGVLAQKLNDGTYLALVIAKVTTAPPVTEVAFDGVLKSIPGNPSSGSSALPPMGIWVVDETRVLVSRATVIRGTPKAGDRVHVEGLKSPDGTVLARLIAKL